MRTSTLILTLVLLGTVKAPQRMVFHSVNEIMSVIPQELVPKDGKPSELQLERINKVLHERVFNHRAIMQAKAEVIERTKAGKYEGRIRIGNGGKDHVQLWYYFDTATDDDEAELAKIKIGTMVKVNGNIARCDIGDDQNLNLDINLAELVKDGEKR